MRNRLKIVALLGSLLAGTAIGAVAEAAQPSGPTVSKNEAKPLKAAEEAMSAQNWDKALTELKQAQSVPNRNAYDNFVIDAWLGRVYVAQKDLAQAAPALESAAQSQYATPEQQRQWLKAVFSIYYQQKDYAKAVQVGDVAIQHGNSDLPILVAQAEYLQRNYKAAAARLQTVVDREPKPDEKTLELLWDCYVKSSDDANAGKVVEKLVTYYPKPDYWLNALAPLLRLNTSDERVQMEIYRLMNELDVLKQPANYTDLAQYAMEQGYPGLTQTVLEQAFARNVYTNQRDKERNQRLLAGAQKRATSDKAQLPQAAREAASSPTGDAYVGVGGGYLSYGEYGQAVDALGKGIAKGGLKYPDEAYLLLGIAQFRAKDLAEARKAFDKVAQSKNPAYARLGRLWALHAKS